MSLDASSPSFGLHDSRTTRLERVLSVWLKRPDFRLPRDPFIQLTRREEASSGGLQWCGWDDVLVNCWRPPDTRGAKGLGLRHYSDEIDHSTLEELLDLFWELDLTLYSIYLASADLPLSLVPKIVRLSETSLGRIRFDKGVGHDSAKALLDGLEQRGVCVLRCQLDMALLRPFLQPVLLPSTIEMEVRLELSKTDLLLFWNQIRRLSRLRYLHLTLDIPVPSEAWERAPLLMRILRSVRTLGYLSIFSGGRPELFLPLALHPPPALYLLHLLGLDNAEVLPNFRTEVPLSIDHPFCKLPQR